MGCCGSRQLVKTPLEKTKPADMQGKSIFTSSAMNLSPEKSNNLAGNLRKLVKHREEIGTSRLRAITGPHTETTNGILISRPKSMQEIKDISKSLSRHFLFTSLSEESITNLIVDIRLFSFGPQEIVFEQNSPGHYFYIILSGRVEVVVNGNRKKIMGKTEQFGELALLHDSMRTATIKTIENCHVWVLSRESFQVAVQSVNKKRYDENKQFIESISIFQSLTKKQKENLLLLLATQEFMDGQRIVVEGDPGSMLYIIKKGCVVCTKSGKEIRKLWPGDFFGEQALLYNTERTATVTSVGKTTLLSLGSDELVQALGSHLQQIIYKNTQRIAIEKNETLRHLTKSQVDNIIDKMRIKSYPPSEIPIDPDCIYMVLKGGLQCTKILLKLYDCIGVQENLSGIEIWNSQEDTDLAEIKKAKLEKIIGGPIQKIVSQNEILSVLKKVQLLRALSLLKLETLAKNLKLSQYSDGEIIFSQGDVGDAFYIVKEGQVEIFKDGVSVRLITKHDFFGEKSIITQEKRTASVVAKGQTVCWRISKDEFLAMIDESIQNQLSIRMELQNDKIKLDELVLVKKLGSGMFGQVFLVYCPASNFLYALKTVPRSKIALYEIQDNLVLERKVLLQIDHPLIIKLVKTFKDENRIYFLMEYVQGLDLFDALREMNILNNENSRFYIGCLVLMLEHLHEREIIYRDLKPENIMIDPQGYPKLIDFGTAKVLVNRTYTIVGTPHYMAPEIIKGAGYGLAADYWTVGIILYEFVCGYVPFGEEEEDPTKVYKKILERKLTYPSYIGSQRSKSVIEKLLSLNPIKRGTIETLKDNPWFLGLNWEGLLGKQIKAPFMPKIEPHLQKVQKASKANKSCCESIAELEELSPLKLKPDQILVAPNWDEDF